MKHIETKSPIEDEDRKESEDKTKEEKVSVVDDGYKRMNLEYIKELCKNQKLYVTPSLNDKLYLHLQGFRIIENLEAYSKVQSLFLGSNRIREISGLDHLSNSLRCLYIQKNMVKDISSGLDKLRELRVLDLSYNFISSVPESIKNNVNLQNLNLSYNKVFHSKDLLGLTLLPNLEVLDLRHNRIEDDVIETLLSKLPNLRVLYLFGNPFVRKTRNYRRRIISTLPQLHYLDTHPITETERKCILAWKSGGIEAERKMRETLRLEKEEEEKENRAKLREMAEIAHQKRERLEKKKKIVDRICGIVRSVKFDWREVSLVVDSEFGSGDGSEKYSPENCRKLFVERVSSPSTGRDQKKEEGRKDDDNDVEEKYVLEGVEPSWDELTIQSFRNTLAHEENVD